MLNFEFAAWTCIRSHEKLWRKLYSIPAKLFELSSVIIDVPRYVFRLKQVKDKFVLITPCDCECKCDEAPLYVWMSLVNELSMAYYILSYRFVFN